MHSCLVTALKLEEENNICIGKHYNFWREEKDQDGILLTGLYRVRLVKLGRCPSQCERSEPGLGELSKTTTLFKSKLRSISWFVTVLWYLTFISRTQSQVGHLKLVILKVQSTTLDMVGHIESVI